MKKISVLILLFALSINSSAQYKDILEIAERYKEQKEYYKAIVTYNAAKVAPDRDSTVNTIDALISFCGEQLDKLRKLAENSEMKARAALDSAKRAKKNAEEEKSKADTARNEANVAKKMALRNDSITTIIADFALKQLNKPDSNSNHAFLKNYADSLFKLRKYDKTIEAYNIAKLLLESKNSATTDIQIIRAKIDSAEHCQKNTPIADSLFFSNNIDSAKSYFSELKEKSRNNIYYTNRIGQLDSLIFDSSGVSNLNLEKLQKAVVFVEGGTFKMGKSEEDKLNKKPGSKRKKEPFKNENDNSPPHDVKLSSFYISKTEVTNKMFAKFLNKYGSDKIKTGELYEGNAMLAQDKHNWGLYLDTTNHWKYKPKYENYPIIHVTWFGAYKFCEFYGYSLPTEAQWEYAAKGGKLSDNYPYSGSNDLKKIAHFGKNWVLGSTDKVAQKEPNELGLFDMSGNLWEWCYDWYDENYYNTFIEKELSIDPKGPKEGEKRVLRGGAWSTKIKERCEVNYRSMDKPKGSLRYGYGFRFCISQTKK